MKKLACRLAFLGAMLPSLANAQLMVDMSKVTCGDYLAMPPGNARVLSAWMSGWFNQKRGYVSVDLGNYAENIAKVSQWCSANPTVTLMSAIQRVATKE
jgi:hypothetical protein